MVENLDHVRAPELSRGRRFALETRHSFGHLHDIGGDELHRDFGLQSLVFGDPDAAHAALTEQALEPHVVADQRARTDRGCFAFWVIAHTDK